MFVVRRIQLPLPVEHGPLSLTDATSLADIVRAAQGNKIVHRLHPDGPVVTAVCRAISGVGFQLPDRDADVRTLFLRVRTLSGEHLWPIAELLPELAKYTTLFE